MLVCAQHGSRVGSRRNTYSQRDASRQHDSVGMEEQQQSLDTGTSLVSAIGSSAGFHMQHAAVRGYAGLACCVSKGRKQGSWSVQDSAEVHANSDMHPCWSYAQPHQPHGSYSAVAKACTLSGQRCPSLQAMPDACKLGEAA